MHLNNGKSGCFVYLSTRLSAVHNGGCNDNAKGKKNRAYPSSDSGIQRLYTKIIALAFLLRSTTRWNAHANTLLEISNLVHLYTVPFLTCGWTRHTSKASNFSTKCTKISTKVPKFQYQSVPNGII